MSVGTASDDIATAIRTYKQSHPYRCDRLGYVNIGVGKVHNYDKCVTTTPCTCTSFSYHATGRRPIKSRLN